MKKYVVVLSVKPAVRLAPGLGRLELNFKELKGSKTVIISRIEEELGGCSAQTGLKMKVYIEARNLDEAIDEAQAFADGVLSFMTLTSGIGMKIPTVDVAYEITADVPERDFVQRFHDPFAKQPSRRVLRHEVLTELMDLFFKEKSIYVDRIQRAVRWYRLGAMTEDIFDQFNCFWIGLEALNLPLQNKLSVGDDPTQCPSCGHKWKQVSTVSGIREFIQKQMPEERNLYQKMRSIRIGIMHSTKRLREMRHLISEVTPKAGEILFRALCYLMDDENWKFKEYRPILKQIPLRLELRGKLIGEDPESLGPAGEDPHLDLKQVVARLVHDKEGGLTFDIAATFTARLNRNVQLSNREIRLYGGPEITGNIKTT